MDPLAGIFGSAARVKLLRLFLFNDDYCAPAADIAKRIAVSTSTLQKELGRLERTGFLKRKQCTIEGASGRKKKVSGWALDGRFRYTAPLKAFLLSANPMHSKEIVSTIGKAGSIKLILISGVFLQNWESRLDILIVGDNIQEKRLESAIKALEALLGKELRFAAFPTKEFEYRLNIYDRLLRDVLDFEHQVILNKITALYPQQRRR